MKIRDVLPIFEAPSNTLVVLKSGDDYRVDPNPDHSVDMYPEAWTQDVAAAHAFRVKAARRFLLRREELARKKRVSHAQLKMVPVVLDADGRPQLPQEPKQPSMLGRFFGRGEAA